MTVYTRHIIINGLINCIMYFIKLMKFEYEFDYLSKKMIQLYHTQPRIIIYFTSFFTGRKDDS